MIDSQESEKLFSNAIVNIGHHHNMQYDSTTGQIGYDNSSRHYKQDIIDLEDDWSKILRVRSVKYMRAHHPDCWEYAYIAEEMDSIGLTNIVFYDDEGQPEDFNYEKMILYLSEMIKKLKQDHDNLVRDVKALTKLPD